MPILPLLDVRQVHQDLASRDILQRTLPAAIPNQVIRAIPETYLHEPSGRTLGRRYRGGADRSCYCRRRIAGRPPHRGF